MSMLGVAHYVVEILTRAVPRMESVSRCERVGAGHKIFPVNCSTQGGSCDRSNQHR